MSGSPLDSGLGASAPGLGDRIQGLDAVRLFARALPGWVGQHGKTVHLRFTASAEGVECDVGFPAGTPEELEALLASLIPRLEDSERLMRLELLVDEFRNVGVALEQIEPLAAEAEQLAARLHPPA